MKARQPYPEITYANGRITFEGHALQDLNLVSRLSGLPRAKIANALLVMAVVRFVSRLERAGLLKLKKTELI